MGKVKPNQQKTSKTIKHGETEKIEELKNEHWTDNKKVARKNEGLDD